MLMLTVLFAAAAIFALAAIVADIRRFAGAAFATHGAMKHCPEAREFRYKVTELKVLRGAAQVHVLPVRRAAARLPVLRAAA
ncbi:MAG: hypothetical protein ACREBO_14060 [Novosphingobium sp.]